MKENSYNQLNEKQHLINLNMHAGFILRGKILCAA